MGGIEWAALNGRHSESVALALALALALAVALAVAAVAAPFRPVAVPAVQAEILVGSIGFLTRRFPAICTIAYPTMAKPTTPSRVLFYHSGANAAYNSWFGVAHGGGVLVAAGKGLEKNRNLEWAALNGRH